MFNFYTVELLRSRAYLIAETLTQSLCLVSMDTDGRVMRLETFSKVIAPGTRTGWIVASEQIVERFVRHSEVSVQNPSGISQLILFKLLDEAWGHAGYLEWLIHIRMEYTARRDNICDSCQQWLPQEITEWTAPMAGMFVSFPSFPGHISITARIENSMDLSHQATASIRVHDWLPSLSPVIVL